ncbi:MAG: cation:proton antiporter, partial [Candidatus Methylomirabilales bacterium]
MGGRVANYFKVPRITGYLVVGMLLSPSVSGVFHERLVKEELTLITHIALAIIAFSIGGVLGIEKIKGLGRAISWITVTQASGAFVVATVVLIVFFRLVDGSGATTHSLWRSYFPMALVIGAISAATAPAAILAIVHEYKAKGPLTTVLLGVVALDDALTIFFYAFAISVAHSFVNLQAISWQNVLLAPTFSILISLSLGGAIGVCIRGLIRFVRRREAMLGVVAGFILLISGLAMSINISPLLANMMFGFMVVNFVRHHEGLFAVVENIEEPIFGMFFTLAGAHFDLGVMKTAGILSLLIVVGRFTGKLLGTRLGAHISHAPQAVKKYLGLALLPKAGVTVGLVLEAKQVFIPTALSEIMVNAVLGSIIINELLTPFLVRFSLFRA